MLNLFTILFVISTFLATPSLFAASATRTLTAFAVSPDGSTAVVGGINHTVILIDTKTMTVQSRWFVGKPILAIDFNKNASVIAVELKDDVLLLDATSGEKITKVPKYRSAFLGGSVDLIATEAKSSKSEYRVKLFSMTDGKEKGIQIKYPKSSGTYFRGITFSQDKKHLIARSSEPRRGRTPQATEPKALKRFLETASKEKNGNTFRVFDLATGSLVATHYCFYEPRFGPVEGINLVGDSIILADTIYNVIFKVKGRDCELFIEADPGYAGIKTATLLKDQTMFVMGSKFDHAFVDFTKPTFQSSKSKLPPIQGDLLKPVASREGQNGEVFVFTSSLHLLKLAQNRETTVIPVY